MSNRLKFLGNRLVTYEVYHRTYIKQDYRRLRRSLYRYMGYKLRFVLKWYKKIVDYTSVEKRRKDRAMNDNLKYWHENGALVVADDETEAFKSMADGNMYTSKSAYYRETKARGYEIVGNDKQEPTALDKYYENLAEVNDIKQDIKEAINGRRD